ncbi:MAG: hypothetical protein ACLTDX_24575 [[Clostridium] innocuum]
MQAGDCLQILREIKDVSFASVDEQGNPQVRIIDVMLVEDESCISVLQEGRIFTGSCFSIRKSRLPE